MKKTEKWAGKWNLDSGVGSCTDHSLRPPGTNNSKTAMGDFVEVWD